MGEPGWWSSPAARSGVADAIRRLIEAGPAARDAMGAAGRDKAVERVGLAGLDRPHGRGLRGGDRDPSNANAMNLLLVAYFYPPCRDTGAHRPAAMAKWLRRLGHRVTVLTTSAYGRGEDPEEAGVVRTADLQRLRARAHGHDRVDALFDSDTYSGRPHPLSRVIVPEPLAAAWAPFARREALRLNRREAFDCVITSSPPESVHAVGRALSRRGVAWVAELRDAWTFEPIRPPLPHRGAAQPRPAAGAPMAAASPTRSCASAARRRGPSRQRWGSMRTSSRTAGTPTSTSPAAPADAAPILDPERISIVYTGRFGSYGRDPRPLVRALGATGRRGPRGRLAGSTW